MAVPAIGRTGQCRRSQPAGVARSDARSMTTPVALTPALAAWAATSSSEATASRTGRGTVLTTPPTALVIDLDQTSSRACLRVWAELGGT
jgi:hypothetical protein